MNLKNSNYRISVARMYYSCATADQYNEWRERARLSRPNLSAWFCTDCTPQYQAKMKAQNKCVRPEIKFKWVREEEGVDGDPHLLSSAELVGYVPSGYLK
jgi:hypothetical protein